LKAVELDPKFGLGYQSAAAMSRNVGKLEDAEKYAKEALRSLDTMTERERFNVRGYYYRTVGDLRQCVSEYGKMLARYSGDTVARNQRAVCMVGLRDMRGAVDELQQAVQILPNHVGYRANLAILMNYAGDSVGAEREARAMKNPPPNAKIQANEKQGFDMPLFAMPGIFRGITEQSVVRVRENCEKMKAASGEIADILRETYSTNAKGAADYGVKVIEISGVNTNSAFDFLTHLMGMKSLSEIIQLSATQSRKNFEVTSAQNRELSELAQSRDRDGQADQKSFTKVPQKAS
jgi:hypothetical protein